MDDDVTAAIEELQDQVGKLAKARTPAARTTAREDVSDARDDLEDVLRREGYRLSRRDLDAILEEREGRKFNERLERALKAREEEADEEAEIDDDGKPKPKPKAK